MKIIKKKSSLKPDVVDFVQKLGLKEASAAAASVSNGKKKKKKKPQTETVTNDKKKGKYEKGQKTKKKASFGTQNGAKNSTIKNATPIAPTSTSKAEIKNKQLLIKPGTVWFEKTNDIECAISEKATSLELTKWRNEAQQLFNKDIISYKQFLKFRKEKSDFAWAQTVLKSGTLTDKMAAHVMLVQDSPVHTLDSIDIMCTMVNTKGKRECILAIDNLRDLFLSCLLVKDRKLKSFEMRPLSKLNELCSGNQEARQRLLLLWHFEDMLKQKYEKFLRLLETIMHDSVEKTKLKAIGVMSELLMENSEQEQYLLSKVVNKIGDPVNRVSGGVIHFLNRVVDCHPNMKRVVIDEVERLLFRLNISPRTQYYCLCFLNQLILSDDDSVLASHLIRLYFAFFKVCVKKGEVDSKMMSALLSGTSRAFPYAKSKADALVEHLDTMFKVVHMVNLNVSIQTLMLIFQALDAGEGPTDRFYTALYKTVLEPDLAVTSRQTMFLNLVFKALKKDPVDRRVKAFLKRLLQVCLYLPPQLVCGILFLISEVLKQKPALLSFNQQTLFSEDGDGDDDEDEHYTDAPLEEDEIKESSNIDIHVTDPKAAKSETAPKGSWFHIKDKRKSATNCSSYNPLYWNPLHCGADTAAFWELCHLKDYFHPSVATFLTNLMKKEAIDYSGDPLQDFTLLRFLERFVYRNPKKQTENVTNDLHHQVFGRRKLYVSTGVRAVPVSSKNYVFQEEDKIPAEEMFLFRYLQKHEQNKGKSKRKDKDNDSVDSQEFDRLLDKLDPGSWDKIDFATEMQKKPKGNKRKSANDDEDEYEEEEEEDDEGLGDEFEEDDFANDEEFKKAFDEYDEELEDLEDPEIEGMATDEEEDWNDGRPMRDNKKKSKEFDPSSLFASAEEFADMLEENATDKHSTITSNAMVNKDKSDAKQLAWETSRNQFVSGSHWKDRKGKKRNSSSFNKGGGAKKRRR